MAPMRQREAEGAAAPRQAANAGRTLAARSGRRNQTAAAAPSGSRNQRAAAAIRRRHARNRRRRALDASIVDREANRRRLSRNLSAQPNAAAADENTIAPAETEAIVDHLMKSVDVAEDIAELKRHEEITEKLQETTEKLQEITEDMRSLAADTNRLESENAEKEAQVQMVMEKLESEKALKAAEVQKVMDENVRLRAMLDKKEELLQALSQQCKLMALNHDN